MTRVITQSGVDRRICSISQREATGIHARLYHTLGSSRPEAALDTESISEILAPSRQSIAGTLVGVHGFPPSGFTLKETSRVLRSEVTRTLASTGTPPPSGTFLKPSQVGSLHLASMCVAPWKRGAGRLKIRFVPYPISTATRTFSRRMGKWIVLDTGQVGYAFATNTPKTLIRVG